MGKQLSACAGLIVLGAMCLVNPRTAAAVPLPSPHTDVQARVALTFDTNILGSEFGDRIEHQLAEELGPVLERTELQVVDTAEIGIRTMRVRLISFDEEQRDYQIELKMISEEAEASLPSIRCDACNERSLVARVVENTPRLVRLHEEKFIEDHPPPDTLTGDDRLPYEPPKPFIGALGISGVTLMGAGVAALGTGAYLLGRDVEHGRAGVAQGTLTSPSRDFRPAGAGTLVAGVVVAGVGAAMLAIDLERARKARTPRFAVQITPNYLGIQLQQRF